MKRYEVSAIITKFFFWSSTTAAWVMKEEILASAMTICVGIDLIISVSAMRRYKVQKKIEEINARRRAYNVQDIQPPTPPKTPRQESSIFEIITK